MKVATIFRSCRQMADCVLQERTVQQVLQGIVSVIEVCQKNYLLTPPPPRTHTHFPLVV